MTSKKEQDEKRVEKEWEAVDNAVLTSGTFLQKNLKALLIGVGAIVLIGIVWWSIDTFYLKKRGTDAQTALFKGEEYFRNQQDSVALYGDKKEWKGMVAFVNEYGSTDAGNVAKAYAGISFARLGKYDEALKFLKEFSGNDELIAPAVIGAIGDCYANQNKVEDAASQFEKAAKKADNAMLTPLYLKKAGIAYRQLKQYDKAIEVFTKIKNDYMTSPEAAEAEKYIAEAEMLKK